VFDITIVISSFNRENKVRKTIDSLFANDLSMFRAVELIVIDDGSPAPVSKVLPGKEEVPLPISMQLIVQNNSGIGATRNRGFREAQSNLVLFLDDDLILEKDTVKKMYEAEMEHPGAVIFGNYPFISHDSEALHQFARQLYGYDDLTVSKSYERVDAITSGLLLVNKQRLGNPKNFYRDDMTIPAAEEHEVIARFHKMGVPIYRAKHIAVLHNHHLELGWMVQQQYKYGLATAEAFSKNPEILDMDRFTNIRNSVKPKGFKRIIQSIFVSAAGRKLLLGYARFLERTMPAKTHNRIFGILTTSFFHAGYHKGLKKFNGYQKN
jgi:glycosyltransferase involved in cell wall biosynthesis